MVSSQEWALAVLTCTSGNGFSLDELVYRTQEAFEREGRAGFVGLLLLVSEDGRVRWTARMPVVGAILMTVSAKVMAPRV